MDKLIADVEHHNIDICTDCALFIANGDVPDEDSDWETGQLGRKWPHAQGWQFSIGYMHADDPEHADDTGADDTEFSSHPCDACGSRLAGSRTAACVSRQVQT